MKQVEKPNWRQERASFEEYQRSKGTLGLFFPFRVAFEKMKYRHEKNNKKA